MNKPTLVVMAAGLGSRYGKLKQLDPVDKHGHMITDYSVYDAYLAGFRKVVFVIKKENKQAFDDKVGSRIRSFMDVEYAFQELGDVPDGFSVPEGRTKPWGTAHAAMSARGFVDGPFAVINADDYYGQSAFAAIYDFLVSDKKANEHAMVGYRIENCLSESGSVSRGICETDDKLNLLRIVERTKIERCGSGAVYTEDDKQTFIPAGTFASLNLWGFSHSMMDEIEKEFSLFLGSLPDKDPLKAEFYLPFVPGRLIEQGKASVKVLTTEEKWYGVTYKQDMNIVKDALAGMTKSGKYPEKLWEG